MLNILVIFTGGTIGSVERNGVVSLKDSGAFPLLDIAKDKAHFESLELCNIMSENVTPDFWCLLYNVIKAIDYNKYDGIIITHGSDTLCYTSCALHELLWQHPLPIVLVAANRPIDENGSNAVINFETAISFIDECNIRSEHGVFVSWSNDDGICHIYYGDDLLQSRVFENRFGAAFSEKAKYVNGELVSFSDNLHKGMLNMKPSFCSDILKIVPYPGINYGVYESSLNSVKAVLHGTYHSSTVCESFAEFADSCKKHKIPLFVESADSNANIYETAKIYNREGVYLLTDVTAEASLVRLMLCCGNFDDPKDMVRAMTEKQNAEYLGIS